MHKRFRTLKSAFLFLCFIGLLTIESVRADEIVVVAGRAMATSYTLKFVNCGLSDLVDEVSAKVRGELARIESIFSLYRSDSELRKLNSASAGEWMQVSEDLYVVAKFAVELAQQTSGAFDPTLRPLIELWQSDRLSGQWIPPSQKAINAKLQSVGTSQLVFQSNSLAIQKRSSHVELDLNALVEGWAIERILDLLKQKGFTDALFELGGEYGAMGCKPGGGGWIIGIEDPQALSRVYATVCLNDVALCTSGSYRQARQYAGKRYSHIIDPRTGYPVEHDLLSVSVLHPSPMLADGWATALMVLGPAEGPKIARKHGLAASFVCQSGNSKLPQLSEAADGKIVLTAAIAHANSLVWALVCGGLVTFSSIAAAWFVLRKRMMS